MSVRLFGSALSKAEKAGLTFRRRRFHLVLSLIDQVLSAQSKCRIVDIGGEPKYWTGMLDMLGSRSFHVTLVNRTTFALDDSRFTSVCGDARSLPAMPDMCFDLVHSNSVIEHVGRWQDMQSMAAEVRRLAPRYFVQTPYFWFPVEPHCMTALFHWLPESVRLTMLMRRARGHWGRAPDVSTAMEKIQSAVLLDCRMLSSLFQDATIYRERIYGLTKSLIAVRRTDPAG